MGLFSGGRMQIGVNVDIDAAIKSLDVFRRDQLPWAVADAVNKTAENVKAEIVQEMHRVFVAPTRWTLNSLYVKRGNKKNPVATVWVKNQSSNGPAPVNWLIPETEGGKRKYKRMEKALQSIGALPSGMMVYPTKFADMDSNGNVKAGQVTQILSYLKAFGTNGFRANMDAKGRKRMTSRTGYSYFVGKPKGKIAGIWKRVNQASGSMIQPIFYFIPSPTYRPRLDFYGVANRVYAAKFLDNFRNAMAKAVETAR